MSQQINSTGTYIGTVTESTVTLTKGGKPQWGVRLKADQKYVESKEDIAHFQAQGLFQDGNPAYVDWSSFDEEIFAYLLLFNSAEEISPQTAMKNVEQISIATGWVAPDFDALSRAPVLGAQILFRVGEKKPYTNDQGKLVGEGQLEVSWVDHKDASPERQLRAADADQIKALMAKVTGYSNKPAAAKPAPAKPVITKPASAPAASAPAASSPAPAAAPATQATPPATSPTTVTPAATPSSEPKKRKAPAPKAAPAPAPAPAQPAVPAALPTEITMDVAWEYVNTNKGDKTDGDVEKLWLESIVGDHSAFTGADWAKVRDTVMAKLAA